MKLTRWLTALALLTCGAAMAEEAAPVVTDLCAEYRSGQTFLTWREAPAPEGTTFNVYLSKSPITDRNLARARLVCRRIGPRSAEDWWLNQYAFGRAPKADPKTGKKPEYRPRGFRIKEGGERLDPSSGLHVHTVAADEQGERYYAVTRVASGREDRAIEPGRNALLRPVRQNTAPIEPIRQGAAAKEPKPGDCKGKPLMLRLHSKGCRRAKQYLVFGDATHGWREGIAFKFDTRLGGGFVTLLPSNTVYVGRPFKEARDRRNRNRLAIFTFWYGCSDKIYDASLLKTGTPTNYSERQLLLILSWARRRLGIDPNRVYCAGSSMGGCGGMSFAFRHPELFAAVHAAVPIVAYNQGDRAKGRKLGWHSNAGRLTAYCGPLSLKCSDGPPLRERLDSRAFVLSHPGDLPFLIIANGRNDTSIPWHNNPDFFRAMGRMRHGCLVAWNDGIHSKTSRKVPPDVAKWARGKALLRFALNKSYPAFSACSADGDPGNGDKTDGDSEGYMNRGLDWSSVKDTPKRYEVLIKWTLKAADLPVTVDVTPRRVQAFRLKPGESCAAVNVDAAGSEIQRLTIKADEHGLFTFPGFRVTSARGNRLALTRK